MSDRLSVLYVDDDLDLRDVAQLSLQLDENIFVRVAESGVAALKMIDSEQWRPDVILLDVMMPGMDGPTVLKALRLRPEHMHTPVIFVTARTQTSVTAGYRELGAAGLIKKPFDPVRLAGDVRRILSEVEVETPEG
jgi:CheY-like chemotaxis protein